MCWALEYKTNSASYDFSSVIWLLYAILSDYYKENEERDGLQPRSFGSPKSSC